MFWAHSGLGVVTLPDFWPTLHRPNLTIFRDEISTMKNSLVHLKCGESVKADHIVMCTGWGDHFAMFDEEHKIKLGLPVQNGKISAAADVDWDEYDKMADNEVNERLPFLASPPRLVVPRRLDFDNQHKWRLFRRVVPVTLGAAGDRSIAILGQIHTVQTPLISEVQSFWAVLYLLGEINLPDSTTMAREVSLWNAWTRKRYLGQGQKYPYSLYDFLPVRSQIHLPLLRNTEADWNLKYLDSLLQDLNLNSRRKSNPLAELFSPYE